MGRVFVSASFDDLRSRGMRFLEEVSRLGVVVPLGRFCIDIHWTAGRRRLPRGAGIPGTRDPARSLIVATGVDPAEDSTG